jgi:hypothetical protein
LLRDNTMHPSETLLANSRNAQSNAAGTYLQYVPHVVVVDARRCLFECAGGGGFKPDQSSRWTPASHTTPDSSGDFTGAGRNALLGDSLMPMTGLGAAGKRMLGGRCVDGMLGEPGERPRHVSEREASP